VSRLPVGRQGKEGSTRREGTYLCEEAQRPIWCGGVCRRTRNLWMSEKEEQTYACVKIKEQYVGVKEKPVGV